MKLIIGVAALALVACATGGISTEESTSKEATVAQDLNGMKTIVSFKGNCKQFVVGDKHYNCSTIFYSAFRNGRVGFNIPIDDGAIMLSGEKDSQLNLTRYTLLVDSVRFGSGSISKAHSASGKCEMHVSPDGEYVLDLQCRASNGIEKIKLDFVGDRSPVDRIY